MDPPTAGGSNLVSVSTNPPRGGQPLVKAVAPHQVVSLRSCRPLPRTVTRQPEMQEWVNRNRSRRFTEAWDAGITGAGLGEYR